MNLNVNFKLDAPMLERIAVKNSLLLRKIYERVFLMATKADFDALNAAISADADAIQSGIAGLNTKIADLTAQLAAGGLNTTEEEAVKADLAANQAKLDAIKASLA